MSSAWRARVEKRKEYMACGICLVYGFPSVLAECLESAGMEGSSQGGPGTSLIGLDGGGTAIRRRRVV